MRVTVTTEKEKHLTKYYVLHAVKRGVIERYVMTEERFEQYPSAQRIAQFIERTGCTFASVEENYYLEDEDELPYS